MTGVVLSVSSQELDSVKLNWRATCVCPNKDVTPLNLQYVVFLVGSNVRAAAEVVSVTSFPNQPENKWVVELSRFVDYPKIEGLSVVDGYGYKSTWIPAGYEEKFSELFVASECVRSESDPQLHLSISEAVEALSLRYDIPSKNIKISLHN